MLAIQLRAPEAAAVRLAVLLSPVGQSWPRLKAPVLRPLSKWK